jgi:hypothetical protein
MSPRAKRISGPEKLWSSSQKDFCNNICQYRTHLPAANSMMSRLSRTIDLRGLIDRRFCSKGQQI